MHNSRKSSTPSVIPHAGQEELSLKWEYVQPAKGREVYEKRELERHTNKRRLEQGLTFTKDAVTFTEKYGCGKRLAAVIT